MPRILLIDDDQPLRTVVAEALTLLGHEVLQAENGREGVAAFCRTQPDVVITDLVMPEQEGIETIMQLRREFPALPIIAISGVTAHANVYLDLARRLGAQRIIPKPFTTEQLRRAIDELLPRPPEKP